MTNPECFRCNSSWYPTLVGANSVDFYLNSTILSSDGTPFHINKRVLEQTCLKLAAHLRGGHADRRGAHIVMQTTLPNETLRSLFHYLWYGEMKYRSLDELNDMLDLADAWQIADMIQIASEALLEEFNDTNCIQIWQLFKKYNLPEQQSVFHRLLYVISRSVQKESNSFFVKLELTELLEILDADLLNVDCEYDVWQLAKKWVLENVHNRVYHVADLIRTIRCEFLSSIEMLEIKRDFCEIGLNSISAEVLQWKKNIRCRVPRDFIIVLGGWRGRNRSTDMYVLDDNRNLWYIIPCLILDRPDVNHQCAVIDKKLYLFGGLSGSRCINSIRCFSAVTGLWTELTRMGYCRSFATVCVLDGILYVIGGWDGLKELRHAEKYDPKTNQWTRISDMLRPTSHAASCALDGKLFVFGGFDGRNILHLITMYCIQTDMWSDVAFMSIPRSDLACITLENSIMIAGGFDGENKLRSVEKLKLGERYTSTMMPMPSSRSNFKLCKLRSRIYAIGGNSFDVVDNLTSPSSVTYFENGLWNVASSLPVSLRGHSALTLFDWPQPCGMSPVSRIDRVST